MNKKILVTFGLGAASFILLTLVNVSASLGFFSTILALIGSFMGIWFLFSLLFKSLNLNMKEKLYLFGGTLLSLMAFGLGMYGFMLFFWLPGAVIGIFFLKFLTNTLSKSTSTVRNLLQDKITKMEGEIKQDQNNQPPGIQS